MLFQECLFMFVLMLMEETWIIINYESILLTYERVA